jgi:hypothetical protein
MRDTTVMIDDTATMLPNSVSNDRSLFDQMEPSASLIDSKICVTASYRRSLTST